MPFLDKDGLIHLWNQIIARLNDKANRSEVNELKALANYIVTTEGTDSAYTATVPGMTAMTKGASFTMIPHVTSGNVAPTLNVNGLGTYKLRRRVSNSTMTTTAFPTNDWMRANTPVQVFYDGIYWIVDHPRPSATDIYGLIAIEDGGTGATTASSALANLGGMPNVAVTSADAGKFLRVSADGTWVAESIPTASGVNF